MNASLLDRLDELEAQQAVIGAGGNHVEARSRMRRTARTNMTTVLDVYVLDSEQET